MVGKTSVRKSHEAEDTKGMPDRCSQICPEKDSMGLVLFLMLLLDLWELFALGLLTVDLYLGGRVVFASFLEGIISWYGSNS
ncbi:hypothetical protein AVEN_223644-1 [Araneus ventricosus]|uniref:Uncharacterized protein n=1 Tax=Araneus ventricosus TaxID=182803 RepID=A0A4Y2JSN0_ARAVE|nr:hypothetical protein AVEN_223644-1 [Araneus ventricosus]